MRGETASARVPRSAQRRVGDIALRTVLVVAVLFAGLGAALVMGRRSQRNAEALRSELATRATIDIRATTLQITAALSGVNGLVDAKGRVEERSFDRFAVGALTHTSLGALAYEPVVRGTDRAAFEAQIGRRIHNAAPGTPSPAPPNDVYYPVRFVSPLKDSTRPLLGFDIRSEPVRAAAADAARDTGLVQITKPVRSRPDNLISVFVVQPLYRPGAPLATVAGRRAAHVGFVTTAFSGDRYLAAAVRSFPPGASLEIRDGDQLIAATPSKVVHRAEAQTDTAGRMWTVTVDDHKQADQTPARTLAFGSVLLAGALAMSFFRSARSDAGIRQAARRSQGLAQLGEAVAAAESGEEVARVVVGRAGPVMAAASTELAILDPLSGVMHIRRSDAERDGTASTTRSWADRSPLTDAIRTGKPVLLGSREAIRAAYPEDPAGSDGHRVRAVAALPMFSTARDVIGAVGFEWEHSMTFDDSTTATMLTIADIGEQTIARARASEFRVASAIKMAELARELTAARTIDEIVFAITEKVPPTVDAMTATVALVDDDRKIVRLALPPKERARIAAASNGPTAGTSDRPIIDPSDEPSGGSEHYLELGFDLLAPLLAPLRRGEPLMLDRSSLAHFPRLQDALQERDLRTVALLPMMGLSKELTGVLIVAWTLKIDFNVVLSAQLGTIRDLCEQTTERARLYSSEHQVVLQLQARTLAPFPHVEGLQLTGRYKPASADVGMGGDWYDAFDIGTATSIVIGDVTGHGIQAVADMTQLRTSISALLRAGINVTKVFATVTDMICNDPLDKMRMATAACLLIDPSKRRAHYASAGHPPMLVRSPNGHANEIGIATQPPIGVPGPAGAGVDIDLEAGSIIVAYTDGLIERRDEDIDRGIERLRLALESAPHDVDAIADHLLATCIGTRPTDDDVALVVIRIT